MEMVVEMVLKFAPILRGGGGSGGGSGGDRERVEAGMYQRCLYRRGCERGMVVTMVLVVLMCIKILRTHITTSTNGEIFPAFQKS